MKHTKYVMLLLIAIVPFNLKSQIINEYGVKVAYTNSKINPKNKAFRTKWRPGINLAFFVGKNIYRNLHAVVQTEYTSRGYKLESIETNETGEVIQTLYANTRLDYITVPILLKINYNRSKFQPFIQFGPRLDYLFNFKRGMYNFSKVQAPDLMPDYLYLNTFSFGSSISLGFQLPIQHKKRVLIEARYNNNFSDARSKPNIFFGNSVSYDFWIGYCF